jgi:predicted enzyme related to lactoylglutathione lyase
MVEPTVARAGGVSYIRIPAPDPARLAAFYAAVFHWVVSDRGGGHVSFEDGTGHVIGHFVDDLPVAGEAGCIPYVFVDSVDETAALVSAAGGELVREPYPEGELRVALFRDVAGNVVGAWQIGPR